MLLSSTVRVGHHVMVYEAATEATCPPGAPAVAPSLDADQLGIVLAVADAGTAMLRGRWRPHADDQTWRSGFHALCRRKGVVVGDTYGGRRIIVNAMTRALGFLEPVWPRLFEDGACGRWTRFVDAVEPRHVTDPVLRVLAEQAVERLPDRPRPFGGGPWPCMNPLGGHFGDERITEVSIRSIEGHWSGVFECECGYSYTRAAFRDGRVTSPRMKRYGPDLTALIATSIAQGRGVTATAEIAQINVALLRRLARKEGFAEWPRSRDGFRRNREGKLWKPFRPGEPRPRRIPPAGKMPRTG